MVSSNKAIKEFIDRLEDEKLQNSKSNEYKIKVDRKCGYRLDHQGMNRDGTGKHRLYIQPMGPNGGGKSKGSKSVTSNVAAQVHLSDPTDPQKVRDALKLSYDTDKGKTAVHLP